MPLKCSGKLIGILVEDMGDVTHVKHFKNLAKILLDTCIKSEYPAPFKNSSECLLWLTTQTFPMKSMIWFRSGIQIKKNQKIKLPCLGFEPEIFGSLVQCYH
jgi:hypothetical protein